MLGDALGFDVGECELGDGAAEFVAWFGVLVDAVAFDEHLAELAGLSDQRQLARVAFDERVKASQAGDELVAGDRKSVV